MSNNVKEDFSKVMLKYEFALETLMNDLKILIREYEFNNKYNPVEHIKSRLKTIDSAINKLEKKGYEVNVYNLLNHIHDMIGVRIVCSFISDVYDIVKVIKNSKQFRIKEEKDYISSPKKSGYTSYHLIILVPIHLNGKIEYVEAEVQIRTIAMDFWASLDHKIQYKFEGAIPEEVRLEMYNSSQDIKALDYKMYRINEIVNKYK